MMWRKYWYRLQHAWAVLTGDSMVRIPLQKAFLHNLQFKIGMTTFFVESVETHWNVEQKKRRIDLTLIER